MKDVEYCFRTKVIPTETLKKDYPNLKDKIKSVNVKAYSTDELTEHLLEEETVCYEFYHKATKYCPKGYYVKFTQETVLEMEDLGYNSW